VTVEEVLCLQLLWLFRRLEVVDEAENLNSRAVILDANVLEILIGQSEEGCEIDLRNGIIKRRLEEG